MIVARRMRAGAAASLVLCAAPLGAQIQKGLAPEARQESARTHPGKLIVGTDRVVGAAARNAAALHTARAVAETIFTIVKRDRAISSPIGYEVNLHRTVEAPEKGIDPGVVLRAGVSAAIWGYSVFNTDRGGEMISTDGRFNIGVMANSAWCDGTLVDDVADGGPAIVSGMRRTGEYRGHPIYDGQCVIVTNRPGEPYLPVTRERVMKMHVQALEAQLEKGRAMTASLTDAALRARVQSDLAEGEKMVKGEEQRLAAMTPADRTAPAWVKWDGGSDWAHAVLVEANSDHGLPFLTPNPAFFDASAPTSRIQVVAVFLPFVQPGVRPPRLEEDGVRRRNAEAIRDGLDWPALEALVRR